MRSSDKYNFIDMEGRYEVRISGRWVKVDGDTLEKLVDLPCSYTPCAAKKGRDYFQITTSKGIHPLLHRFVMGAVKGQMVDHIDNDPLNNTRDNLRFCTTSENSMNTYMCRRNSSGYRGVTFRKDTKKWQAQIGIYGKQYNLGSFDDPAEASRVYEEAAKKAYPVFYRNHGKKET